MPETQKIPIILDGDPGHDDAIAWVFAHGCGLFDILAVTSVGGNQTIEKTTYNSLRVCTLIGLNAPVARGCYHPLNTEQMNAPTVHGESGLDGPALPEPAFPAEEISGIELWARVIRNCDRKVTIVSTGPLTNTAAFLLAHPELKDRIERISLMGGGCLFGNWTPAAEFNILVDPEAAKIVYESGVPILMAGIDVTEKALIKPADFERIKALNNPVSDIVWQWLEFFYQFHKTLGYEGAPMHDPCAVMVLVHPEIFTIRDFYVQIETCGDYCKGATITDWHGTLEKEPNVSCLLDLDREVFVDYLIDSIRAYGEVDK